MSLLKKKLQENKKPAEPIKPVTKEKEEIVEVKESSSSSIHEKIKQLEQAIHDDTPEITTALVKVHQILLQDPEIVWILSPEEIGAIFTGLQPVKQLYLQQVTTKKKGKMPTAEEQAAALEDFTFDFSNTNF